MPLHLRTAVAAAVLACLGGAQARAQAAPAATPASAPASTAVGGSGHAGLMFGNGFGFWLEPPAGWVLDASAGRANGAYGTFYRQGESWRAGAAVMYASSMSKSNDGVADAAAAAAKDAASLRAESPGMRVEEAPALPTGDGRTALVRYFRAAPGGNVEAVAYVDEHDVVALVVLSARSEQAFAAALPDFARLVATYSGAGAVNVKAVPAAKH
jgi:hypothetical protein